MEFNNSDNNNNNNSNNNNNNDKNKDNNNSNDNNNNIFKYTIIISFSSTQLYRQNCVQQRGARVLPLTLMNPAESPVTM